MSVTRHDGQLLSCTISEKTNDSILRKRRDGQTDRQKDGQTDECDIKDIQTQENGEKPHFGPDVIKICQKIQPLWCGVWIFV